MAGNTFLRKADSIGYGKQTATATAFVKYIDPYPGYKPVVYAFQFISGTVISAECDLEFFRAAASTDVSSDAPSGGTSIRITSTTIGGTTASLTVAALATGDYLCIELDNGTYTYDTIASVIATTSAVNPVGYLEVTNVLTDTVATGNRVWGLGISGDGHNVKYHCSLTAVTNTVAVEDGIFFGKAKGDPMMMYFLNATSTCLGAIQYLTYGYISS
jgi:hypothetical protein